MNKANINYILFFICILVLLFDFYDAVINNNYTNLVVFAVVLCLSLFIGRLKR